jgi:hypothetical protein
MPGMHFAIIFSVFRSFIITVEFSRIGGFIHGNSTAKDNFLHSFPPEPVETISEIRAAKSPARFRLPFYFLHSVSLLELRIIENNGSRAGFPLGLLTICLFSKRDSLQAPTAR